MNVPALDAPLSLISDYWLETRCKCRQSYTPIKLLSKRIGSNVRLGDVLPRLKCERCGERPKEVALVDDPSAGASGVPGGQRQVRIVLSSSAQA